MINSFVRRTLTATVLMAACTAPSFATVVNFEDVAPALFSAPDSVSSGGYRFASSGAGFSGVDDAGAFVFGNAPANSAGQFLFGLNADGLTMTASAGGAFRLDGFDASFIAPLGGLGASIAAGQLRVDAIGAGNEIVFEFFDFSLSDSFGNFNFSSFNTGSVGNLDLTSATFTACVFDGIGGCSFTDPQAQFALDDIRIADDLRIPEPGTGALALVALGILTAFRRRSA
jgi:MYXO-CTERM domain-containing protein